VDPAVVASFFAAHPRFRLAALGHAANFPMLNLAPHGVPVTTLDAARDPEWVARYHAANAAAFGGPLALPGWVLVDLYLLPSVVTLLVDGDDVVAAWCGVPTVTPGVVMGVSLFSTRRGLGAASVVKSCGVAMHRAHTQRGITQWDNPALRAHCRLGPLRVVGPAPAVHGAAERSFVYECAVGAAAPVPVGWIPVAEGPRVAAEAAAGACCWVVSPGLRAGCVAVAAERPPPPG